MRKKKYWAGFCDGKIHVSQNLSGMNVLEVFLNKKHAKRFYQDVRAIIVRQPKEKPK